MANAERFTQTNRLLVKLRPSNRLRAAESRANLRPLYSDSPRKDGSLGLGSAPGWFLADMHEGAENPWDLAHSHLAARLGVSDSDVIFAEPDMIQTVYEQKEEERNAFAVGERCETTPQDWSHGKPTSPDVFAWHLADDFTQLGRARQAVEFADPRTRIAHFDTGYYRAHETAPEHIVSRLERSFVSGDADPQSSVDPDNRLLVLDNSGHGTGTIGILAGGKVTAFNGAYLGGAPGAEILPLRIADSVVLLQTSAFARAIRYATEHGCDVMSMSMGGLPSRAWNEAVNDAYLHGLCMVSAAGNNANGLPTRHLVYPARYGRVIAACGVMANGEPYSGLEGLTTLEGNYGPDSVMNSALAAYTPNIPWACFGCPETVRLDGEGTSSATPQISAAVALWLEKYKNELPRDWRRVEAVRHALFGSAKLKGDKAHLGMGVLQAFDALAIRPVLGLPQTKADDDSFAFLRVITGLGIAQPPPRELMFNLELSQRWLLSPVLQEIVPDPEATSKLNESLLKKLMEAIIEDDGSSKTLRAHVMKRYAVVQGSRGSKHRNSKAPGDGTGKGAFGRQSQPALRHPPYRRLRVYAIDPSLSTHLDTADLNEVTLKVRWEDLEGKGPVGEYLAVQDVDAGNGSYEGVNLDEPWLLAQDGWAPSEGNPQFHQQMVYAVAMRTVDHFERALGRPIFWRSREDPKDRGGERTFVKQLTVRPHAFREANAYYSPDNIALLFGYFEASDDDPAAHMPGSRIYTCLSHDIIAHETTHAILDGMHRRFNEPTNPDVLALHEAFADIVAMMQHFTIPEILESEISRTRGDMEAESMLGKLAIQFGRATGGHGALRDAIGRIEKGRWKRTIPDPSEISRYSTPHARGAILVAAVFDAFIAIYKARVADLLRIYTGGTGVLAHGAIHPDLVRRLANEATKSAGHVLSICIRALDYMPPVDVTFFEYLRALVTADFDMVSDDRHNYRVAFVEAFRRRGIYPVNLSSPTDDTPRTLSADTLRWQGFQQTDNLESGRLISGELNDFVGELREFADSCFYIKDREKLFHATGEQRKRLQNGLEMVFRKTPQFATRLGLNAGIAFEVHDLRRAMRIGPDGRYVPQMIIELTQSTEVRENKKDGTPGYIFSGGSTLVVDLSIPEIKYRIVKNIASKSRQQRTADYVRETAADPLRALFLSSDRREPFAILHALEEGNR